MKVLLAITIWFTINIFVRIHYLWYVSIWKGGDFILQSYPHWGNWIYRYVSFFAKPPDCSTFSPLNVPDLKPIFHLGNAMAISQEKRTGLFIQKIPNLITTNHKKRRVIYLPMSPGFGLSLFSVLIIPPLKRWASNWTTTDFLPGLKQWGKIHALRFFSLSNFRKSGFGSTWLKTID